MHVSVAAHATPSQGDGTLPLPSGTHTPCAVPPALPQATVAAVSHTSVWHAPPMHARPGAQLAETRHEEPPGDAGVSGVAGLVWESRVASRPDSLIEPTHPAHDAAATKQRIVFARM